MFDLRSLEHPIVQAPMAGGPSTPALAIAVARAGGLGFVAAGYRAVDAIRSDIASVRAASDGPFGVNLFVPSPRPADPVAVREYMRSIEHEAAAQGVELGEPRFDDDGWEAKLSVVCEERVPVISFTFGCPPSEVVRRLHACGCAVWVTVTTPEEASVAAGIGADAIVAQGVEAGGHRGGFSDRDDAGGGLGLLALLALVRRAVSVPLVAAGGIADGSGLAAVLCAGAAAGQIGTALMLAPEAGTNDAQRAVMNEPIPTRLTRAFTGRLARGIENRFMLDHSAGAPSAYPEIHHVTAPLRAAARERGDTDAFNLWAGQAHAMAQARPAGEIVQQMAEECRAALKSAGGRPNTADTGPRRSNA